MSGTEEKARCWGYLLIHTKLSTVFARPRAVTSTPGDCLAGTLSEEECTRTFFLACAKLVAHILHLLRCQICKQHSLTTICND